MADCRKFRPDFVDALYHELEAARQEAFDAHLEQCETCRNEFQALEQTLRLADRKSREVPGTEFLDNFWQQLTPQLHPQKVPWWRHFPYPKLLWDRIWSLPTWSYGIAAATAIFLIGFFAGALYFSKMNQTTAPDSIHDASALTLNQIAVKNQALNYIERSKIILLGLVNLDTEVTDPKLINFTHQQKISRDLLNETSALKIQLTDSKEMQLLRLISELELILLQIANFEKDFDVPAIEIITSGVENQSILFKINLEEMKLATQLNPIHPKPNEL